MEADGYAPTTVNRKMQSLLKREAKAGCYTLPIPDYKPASEWDYARQYVLSLGDEALILERVLAWDSLSDVQRWGACAVVTATTITTFVFLADVGYRLSQSLNVR